MRKLLVMFLILGFAAVTSATPYSGTISLSGPGTITVSSSATYQILYSGDDIVSFDVQVGLSNSKVSLTDGAILATSRNTDYGLLARLWHRLSLRLVRNSGCLTSRLRMWLRLMTLGIRFILP